MPESIDWPRMHPPRRRRRLLIILAVLAGVAFGGRTALYETTFLPTLSLEEILEVIRAAAADRAADYKVRHRQPRECSFWLF